LRRTFRRSNSSSARRYWHIESFHSRLRDEWLSGEIFFHLTGAREKLERLAPRLQPERPHTAFADRTPKEFARAIASRPFALPIINKTEPSACQGFAVAGQNTPAFDTL